MLLDRLLISTAERFPNSIAAVQGERRVNYKELYDGAVKVASILQGHGIRRGDRIIIALENSVEYIISYFGVLLAGGVTVAINPDIKPAGLQKIILDCTPAGIISRSNIFPVINACKSVYSIGFILLHGNLGPVASSDPTVVSFDSFSNHVDGLYQPNEHKKEELASIIYTSGTTGEPKGVMLSHKNLVSNANSIISYLGLTEQDSMVVVLPFYYSYGNSILLTHVMQGAKLVIDNRFLYPNVVLDHMVKEEVTGFAGVPSTFAILLYRSNFRHTSIPSLRYLTQAGGPMPHDMAFEIMNIYPHARLFIMYGQTEASARLSYLPPDELWKKKGSVGKGIPGVTLEVIKESGEKALPGEVGEVTATGDNIMTGYWGKEEDTKKVLRDNRLFTGDIATVDEDGYVYILGRSTEMIKSGAHRIAPREIEEIILKHPKVSEVAVVGQKDPILGEAICSFLVLKEGEVCTEKEFMHFCHKNLPTYKMPRTIRFVPSFPKTESGKIKKEELKKLLINCEVIS